MKPEEIATIRMRLGLSQEKFARLLGCGFGAVNRWERGKNKPMSIWIEKMKKLAEEGSQGIKL